MQAAWCSQKKKERKERKGTCLVPGCSKCLQKQVQNNDSSKDHTSPSHHHTPTCCGCGWLPSSNISSLPIKQDWPPSIRGSAPTRSRDCSGERGKVGEGRFQAPTQTSSDVESCLRPASHSHKELDFVWPRQTGQSVPLPTQGVGD